MQLNPENDRTNLPIGDDLCLNAVCLNEAVYGTEICPQVVGIEHLELCNRLKFINVVFGYLQR